ncbi:MAG: Spy/CpxP family protein refolding chaperone [Calditrichia bacterium]
MRNIWFVMVLLVTVFLNGFLLAQPPLTIDQKVEKLKTSLDLNEEQTADLQLILRNSEKQAQNIRELNRDDAEAIKVAMADLDKETDQQIRNILTTEQQKKYENVKGSFPPAGGLKDREISELKERLNLTDAQVAQIEPILTSTREQMHELRENRSGDRQQMRSRMQSIMQERDKKIEAILTESQKQEYRKYIQERRQEWGKRRGQWGNENRQ